MFAYCATTLVASSWTYIHGNTASSNNGMRVKSDSSFGGTVSGVSFLNTCETGVEHLILVDPQFLAAVDVVAGEGDVLDAAFGLAADGHAVDAPEAVVAHGDGAGRAAGVGLDGDAVVTGVDEAVGDQDVAGAVRVEAVGVARVSGLSIRTPQAVNPVPRSSSTLNIGELVRLPFLAVRGDDAGIMGTQSASGAQGLIDGRGGQDMLGTSKTWWALAESAHSKTTTHLQVAVIVQASFVISYMICELRWRLP